MALNYPLPHMLTHSLTYVTIARVTAQNHNHIHTHTHTHTHSLTHTHSHTHTLRDNILTMLYFNRSRAMLTAKWDKEQSPTLSLTHSLTHTLTHTS